MAVTDIKKVLIIAGGTGGHVMPALAVAQDLRQRQIDVHWVGTKNGIEQTLVPASGFPLSYISITGLRGKRITYWLMAPLRIANAIRQSWQILRREKPDCVLSMGGYVSGPGAVAAYFLRIPFLLHEQNAIEGWTNRLLSHFAKRILVAFPNTFLDKLKKVVVTGNPIRREIMNIASPEARFLNREHSPLRILVLGGSLGAQRLNEVVPKAIALFPASQRPTVWHQTGKLLLEKTKKIYDECGVQTTLTDFIGDMSAAYEWADIVVCRSGAITIAEIATVGVPSILIPFPYAIGDHQTFNARFLSENRAAILLPQSQLNEHTLFDKLNALHNNKQARYMMAQNCRILAQPMATTKVVEQCIEVGCGN